MADIFVSYASADRDKVEKLAAALGTQGWSVWWDRNIPTAKLFHKVIESELNNARCVLVCWSKKALESDFVHAEAEEARQQRKVVPVRIEDVVVPLVYRPIQSADLIKWSGKKSSPEFQKLVADITSMIGMPGFEPPQSPAEPPLLWPRRRLLVVTGGVVGGVSVGAGVILWLRQNESIPWPEPPIVAAQPPANPRFVPDDVKLRQRENRHQQMPPSFARGFYLTADTGKTVHYVNRDGLALYANGLRPDKLEPVDPIDFVSNINPPALTPAVEKHVLFLISEKKVVQDSLELLGAALLSIQRRNHPSNEDPTRRLEELFAELSLRFEGGNQLRELIDHMEPERPHSVARLSRHLQQWEEASAQERRKPFRWIQPAICVSAMCDDVDEFKVRIAV